MSSVVVTAINLVSSDNACGMNGNTFAGFNTSLGGYEEDTLTVPNVGYYPNCTISSVHSRTSGFGISGANVPLTIPYEGIESLSFAIAAPGFPFTGVLTIDLE